jgi:AcrR family transcriptional regulator
MIKYCKLFMSPRPYDLGKRAAAVDQTRERIISAARQLLAAERGLKEFSVEAVARQADVARMTVYYQFGSRLGLLEALYDHLAERGQMFRLAQGFHDPDPLISLSKFIAVFIGFWSSDRLVIRRLRGLATVDPDVERGIKARDERRRHGLQVILGRLKEHSGCPDGAKQNEVVDVLHMLTSFETFDGLKHDDRSTEEITTILNNMVLQAIGLSK